MPSPIKRTTTVTSDLCKEIVIACLAAAALIAAPSTTMADDDGGIRLFLQNMDEGTDFIELGAARTPAEFVAAVTTTYNNILATKPAERAAAMAREIAQQRPDLVALQEASVLRIGNGGPATTVRSDLLQLLLDALAGLGQPYVAVAIFPGFDAQAPSTLGFNVRLTTQDAILVRANLQSELKVSNLQIQEFGVKAESQTAVGPLVNPNGWAAIDVRTRGSSFRFVTTHLDAGSPAVRVAQAGEMLLTAANTSLPVIFAGDFNIDADSSLDPSFLGYLAVINTGFTDAWRGKRGPDPGFTCCQAENVLNPTSLLNQRSDLVLFRGAFGVADISLIGNQPADRTSSGLWPSDHAGVAATLLLPSRDADNQ
jgi:endonuclease/exonuclease/phosphatase family metal-dependent hydrolase